MGGGGPFHLLRALHGVFDAVPGEHRRRFLRRDLRVRQNSLDAVSTLHGGGPLGGGGGLVELSR